MFKLIPAHTNIPFMKYKSLMVVFSVAMSVGALYFILTKGFNYGVDFAGGIELVVKFPPQVPIDAEHVRDGFSKIGIADASVQSFHTKAGENENQFIVHFPAAFAQEEKTMPLIEKALKKFAPGDEKIIRNFRFSGLERAYLTLSKEIPLADLKATLTQIPFGMLQLLDIQPFGRGSSGEYQMNFSSISQIVLKGLNQEFKPVAGQEIKIEKVDFVGSKVGADLKSQAILSFLITILLTFMYIFLRFDLIYAPGVSLSMIHDVLIVAGIFSWVGMEFDLTIVAALLTLAGYSINDTIIVYDRIREVAASYKGKTFVDIINVAANQTLSRTIITSGLVFLATLALYLWGGPVIHGFAFAFLVGVVVGTYSSVFVAAPTILLMQQSLHRSDIKSKKAAA